MAGVMRSTEIPALYMRGGTSKGLFFDERDLPRDPERLKAVLLAAMGSPDPRQIDGVGGGHPLTSKVAIVASQPLPGVDLDYFFVQVWPDRAAIETGQNCGNMLAAVVPFALETGLLAAQGETTTARVRMRNTGGLCDITVQTPGGQVTYEGDCRIDGVPGSHAPVRIRFLDTAGSVCGALLPTGNVCDRIDGIDVTCIDNGMPLVILPAEAVGVRGDEPPAVLNANAVLKERLEKLRLECGKAMGLGDVREKTYPKMTLVSSPQRGGSIATRSFIPHVCHEAIGVLAAVTVATACAIPGSIAARYATNIKTEGDESNFDVEHPSGYFTVTIESDPANPLNPRGASLLRTARLLMRGSVLIPSHVWHREDK